MKINSIKISVNFTKYLPIIINLFLLFIYEFWHYEEIREMYLYIGFGQSLIYNLYLLTASIAFGFCIWHQVLIVNMSMCLLIEYLNNKGLFMPDIFDVIIKLTIASLVIAAILYYKHGCYSKKEYYQAIQKSDIRN